MNSILDRVEDSKNGELIGTFQTKVPEKRMKEIAVVADILGERVWNHFQFVPGAHPMADMSDKKKAAHDLVLNRSWKASMAVTGAEGLPAFKDAGNVLRPETALKVSIRIPPTLDSKKAAEDLKAILTKDPPYGAKVEVTGLDAGAGIEFKETKSALDTSIKEASRSFFKNDSVYYGEGGSIPFLGELAERVTLNLINI